MRSGLAPRSPRREPLRVRGKSQRPQLFCRPPSPHGRRRQVLWGVMPQPRLDRRRRRQGKAARGTHPSAPLPQQEPVHARKSYRPRTRAAAVNFKGPCKRGKAADCGAPAWHRAEDDRTGGCWLIVGVCGAGHTFRRPTCSPERPRDGVGLEVCLPSRYCLRAPPDTQFRVPPASRPEPRHQILTAEPKQIMLLSGGKRPGVPSRARPRVYSPG
jgi:hypothetical protein